VCIAGDHVERDSQRTPHRWNMRLVRNFMVTFGLVSTAFDLLTFAVLLHFFGDNAELFRTGWFVESLLTELLILFIIRTAKPFYRSRPGRVLTLSSCAVIALTLTLPYLPLAAVFGLVPLPAPMMFAILLITVLYLAAPELAKHRFYQRQRS
jgi:P-type Mg2+ transporter